MVYNYSASSETVTQASQTINVGTHRSGQRRLRHGLHRRGLRLRSGLSVTYGSSGSCSNTGASYTMTSSTGTCTVTFDQAGNGNYTAASR